MRLNASAYRWIKKPALNNQESTKIKEGTELIVALFGLFNK